MTTVPKRQTVNLTHLARLIDDGGAIDRDMKALKLRLDPIKEELTDAFLDLGLKKIEGLEDFDANGSFTSKFDAISPVALKAELEKLGLGHRLFDVLKVDMTALKTIREIPPVVIDRLKGEAVATQVSISFKPKK